MAHNHMMHDKNRRFVINPITRMIDEHDKRTVELMQFDHNSERMSFKMDRYVEGHDLSLCNSVEIHFINVGGNNNTSKGVYLVEDLTADTTETNTILFSWLVSETATQFIGPVNFVISFKCTEEGELLYRWNTGVNSHIRVSKGIDNGEYIYESYSDIIETWRLSLFGIGETLESSIVQMAEQQKLAIEVKGMQVKAGIPDSYEDLQSSVDELAMEKYVPQTTFEDGTITEVYEDGHYKVTTFDGDTITEETYTSDDELVETKIIKIGQNEVTETITDPT